MPDWSQRGKCPSVKHVLCFAYITHQFGPRLMNEEAHGQVEVKFWVVNNENDTAHKKIWKRGHQSGLNSNERASLEQSFQSYTSVGNQLPSPAQQPDMSFHIGLHQQVVSHHFLHSPSGLDTEFLFSIETTHSKPTLPLLCLWSWMTLACGYYLCLSGLSSFVPGD